MAWVEIKSKIPYNKNECERIGEFWYNPKEKSILLDHPFPLPMQVKITDWYYIEVTHSFLLVPNLVRANIDFDLLCLLIDSIWYTERNCILLHASCYNDGKGILNVGFQNTGKTYNTYKAVSQGATLVSEEHTVINQDWKAHPYRQYINSCLSWTTIRDCGIYITPSEWLLLVFRTARAKLLPFMFEAAISKKKEIVGRPESSIDEIRTNNKQITDDVAKKLIYFTENEYNFYASQLLCCYAYASGFDLMAINAQRKVLIRQFADYVDSKRNRTSGAQGVL